MGRRSINTTKSGKYMNPTDQARKEARKKELKKNKKQRQMVRAAVLKGKDPVQLIAEMEKIDQMEYNVLQPPPLNEKVLKDKRKKLKETLERVMTMYDKDDPDKWAELKRMEVEYEKRRIAMVTYAESVRHAQQVQVDDIPLPTLQLPNDPTAFMGLPSQIPLPTDLPVQLSSMVPHPMMTLPGIPVPPGLALPPPHGILKKTSAYSAAPAKPKKPPGVPPGPPPELSDDEEEPMEEDGANYKTSEKHTSAVPSDVQEKIPPPAGLPPRQRVIRFADDEAPEPTSEQTPAVPTAPTAAATAAAAATPSSATSSATAPKMSESRKEKDDENMSMEHVSAPAPKPTTLQQKMLAMAGQDIDQFMREMEEVHRKREQDRAADLNARLSMLDSESSNEAVTDMPKHNGSSSNVNSSSTNQSLESDGDDSQTLQPPGTGPTDLTLPPPTTVAVQPQPSVAPGNVPVVSIPATPPTVHPPGLPVAPPLGLAPMMFRPPPLRPGVPPPLGIRLPPGPPPGRPGLPPGPPPGLPPRLGMRLPPGPPPGMPPRLLRPPGPPPRLPTGIPLPGMPLPTSANPIASGPTALSSIPIPPGPTAPLTTNPNVLSAAPQLINRTRVEGAAAEGKKQHGATIEAKPQIRNLSADVTRFLPTALRVKREDKKKKDIKSATLPEPRTENLVPKPSPATSQQTKDDAYMQFMREMEGLL
ncbi:WW domain-binding protein 11 [Periplaneta americana]|uniref:WW domain-binding protein 11 n=1 Tax=Periplaneta americana TaxID=6978 RepID=UPI0037E73F3A